VKLVSANEWISNNIPKTSTLNKAFHDDALLKKVFDNVLFAGNVSHAPTVDAIFH
jgi:hypothetical protein